MKLTRRLLSATLATGMALALVACNKVPYTGRKQFNLVPDSIMRGVGKASYSSMLAELKVEKRGEDVEILEKVGRRISRVADEPKYDWEFTLADEDEVNAWCLPGGYITFYTGILPVLENEAGMAFVMGHEVAHATAHHSSERLSQQLTLIGGLGALEIYMSSQTGLDKDKRQMILAALGVGATVGVLLPYSRTHESEADVIGMMYMAEAGYPPKEGGRVWDRMASMSSNGTPVFLSTHPSNEQRKANLAEWEPQAQKKYQRNKVAYDSRATLWGKGDVEEPPVKRKEKTLGATRPDDQ